MCFGSNGDVFFDACRVLGWILADDALRDGASPRLTDRRVSVAGEILGKAMPIMPTANRLSNW
jgi:hypothetical protein